MKIRIPLLPLLTLSCSLSAGHAADSVTVKGGETLLFRDGQAGEVVTNEFNLTPAIKISTNQQFAVNNGALRTLGEGQTLDSEGLLSSPNGAVEPAEDHFAMKAGRLYLVKDGTPAPVGSSLRLANGTQAAPDGAVVTAKGQRIRLLDGQWFKLDGSTIPTRDRVTLLNGKVTVQKEGSLLAVEPGRSLMMNDGTKVLGDGTLIRPDGSKLKLQEGKPVQIEGVVRKLR